MEFKIEKSWNDLLQEEFKRPYMSQLFKFVTEEIDAGKSIYPPLENVFEAFRLTPFHKVKVILIGQDPYHGRGQSHGLCFSVRKGVKLPPSLINIFKELKEDLGIDPPGHGCLESWAQQGVLLLNTVLTVEEAKAGSHHSRGWEIFTDKVIEVLDHHKEHLIFILWGSPAQKKARKLNPTKHLILKSAHPSPLSVYRGFLGSRPFSKTNAYLRQKGIPEIDWRL